MALRFRKTLTFLILATALVFALPAGAQQKNIAPGLSPARAYVAASLPRHGGVKPPLRQADLKVSATTAASEPASAKKPLNQVQVFALLAGGVPSHRVTMLVQERGIDFEPTDDYLQEVRLAGGEDEQTVGFSKKKCFLASAPVREDKPGRRLGSDWAASIICRASVSVGSYRSLG